jgi:succinate-acetate transporter protein
MANVTQDIENRLTALEAKVAAHAALGTHSAEAPKLANPAPLGLFAFGITTLLLNLVNSEVVEAETISLVLGYGMFFGGLAQFCAGMWEVRTGNTFGATAFSAYGAFWMGLAFWHVLADGGILHAASEFKGGFAAYLGVWGMFTGLMFIPALKLSKGIQSIFFTLTVLFFLLAAGQYNGTLHVIAGYWGILCAFTAIYTAWALLTNEIYGKTVLPWV